MKNRRIKNVKKDKKIFKKTASKVHSLNVACMRGGIRL